MTHSPLEAPFIPKPARIAAIIQLCLVFTLILFWAGYPFLSKMMADKGKALLFQSVMGKGELISTTYKNNPIALERLERNSERFQQLPLPTKDKIKESYQAFTESSLSRSTWDGIKESLHLLLFGLPPFIRAWIAAALCVSLMLLLKYPGAPWAALLLPVITLFCMIDNLSLPQDRSNENNLFPSEEYIIQTYVGHPLAGSMEKQQLDLLNGWQNYLSKEWSKLDPEAPYEMRVETGEFAFNLQRLLDTLQAPKKPLFHREPLTVWIVYLFWNILYAFLAWRCRRPLVKEAVYST